MAQIPSEDSSDLQSMQLNESPMLSEVDDSRTFFGGSKHPWRRLFAKQVDLFVLCGVPAILLGLGKVFSVPIIAGFFMLGFWLPAEALLLSIVGTTPGRWLLGITVRTSEDQKLSLGKSCKRAILVATQGMAFLIPYVAIIPIYFAYKRLTKTGTTLWDSSVGSVVTHAEWRAARVFLVVALSLAAISMLLVSGRYGTAEPNLKQIAVEINKQLPMMADSSTRVDSAIGMNRTLQYNLTLVEYSDEELDPSGIEKAMTPGLTTNICTTEGLRVLAKQDVTFIYAYHGKNGKLVTKVTILSPQCDGS